MPAAILPEGTALAPAARNASHGIRSTVSVTDLLPGSTVKCSVNNFFAESSSNLLNATIRIGSVSPLAHRRGASFACCPTCVVPSVPVGFCFPWSGPEQAGSKKVKDSRIRIAAGKRAGLRWFIVFKGVVEHAGKDLDLCRDEVRKITVGFTIPISRYLFPFPQVVAIGR